jgi:hypothetical protein
MRTDTYDPSLSCVNILHISERAHVNEAYLNRIEDEFSLCDLKF